MTEGGAVNTHSYDQRRDPLFKPWWIALVGLSLLMVVGGQAHATTLPDFIATSARSASFGGHPLLRDVGDVVNFPQLSLDHTGVVQINVDTFGTSLGPALGSLTGLLPGSALVIMEAGGNAYGASLYGHYWARDNVAHLYWGKPMGENKLGVGLSVGLRGQGWLGQGCRCGSCPEGGDVSPGSPPPTQWGLDDAPGACSDEGNWGFRLAVGYSIGQTDLALTLIGNEERTLGNNDTGPSGITVGLGLTARSIGEVNEGVAWGWTAAANAKAEDEPSSAPEGRATYLDVGGSFGPIFHVGGATAAVHGVVGFSRVVVDPDGGRGDEVENDRTITDSITAPGLELAGEFPVKDWLVLRLSTGYRFDITTVTDEAAETTTQTFSNGDGFTWAAGVGLKYGNVTIDAVLKDGFVVNGPKLVGGDGGGLANQVSVNYSF